MTERPTYSPFPLINLALDNARLLIAVPLAAAVVAVLLGLLFGGRHTAHSSFRPQGDQQDLNRLSGLAAQFGIDVPGGNRGESVDFYARLVRSRALLEDVVQREYLIDGSRRATLIELYDVPGSGATQLRRTVERLSRRVSVEADLNAGVVGIRTRDRSGSVAEQINRAILDEVNRFNLERRQSQASAERSFVEAQAARAREDLTKAEEELSLFMQTNRRYEEWPQLRFEAARLQRQVDLQQQMVMTLSQGLERARLDEVRNTPVITILDRPEGSAKRERKLFQKAVLGGVLGLTLVLAFLFLRDYTDRLRQQYPDEYARVRKRRPWVAALFLLALGGCEGSTIEPVGFSPAVSVVSAGAEHTCALTQAGVAFCWGRGADGELGNGQLSGSAVPRPVSTELRFRDLSSGQAHTCALTDDGTAYCWGWNAYFQRGNAHDTATARPVLVTGDHRFSMLDAGSNHTCALKADGTAWCWGYNRYGQLGDGSTSTNVAVAVATPLRFNTISAGGHHTCGLTTNTTGPNVYCWGFNSVGQLGVATDTILATAPVAAAGAVRMDQLSAGYDHTCGIAGSALYCWGGNAHGQLANGGAFPAGLPGATSPTRSPTPTQFRSVAAGTFHTCGVATTGQAFCWGRGGAGQLGVGSTADHYHPQAVHLHIAGGSDLLTFSTLSLGDQHTCGRSSEDVVFCWGSGGSGQVGQPAVFFAMLPVRVPLTNQ
jgi:alpha-tubulin suppressor-like RCC1 family protein